ncbi:MAG: tRNA 5-methoxyuridine(34)/uridine 5-oxyacetic acid(34) synthase CmoB [Mariprofundaceae bacterium]
MKDYKNLEASRLKQQLDVSSLASYTDELTALNEQGWEKILKHGDLARWAAGFHALPSSKPTNIDLNTDRLLIGLPSDTDISPKTITEALKSMHPWRKGPFEVFGVHIDTEWRSDWKWNRIKDHLTPLKDRTILDVGCGSGYHMWRMLGADAKLIIGIDPTPLFSMHFASIKQYQPKAPAFIIPIGIDDMPDKMESFDTVFSMGILYHRRSPIDHLIQLKELLNKEGELVLETLVIEGNEQTCLIPEGRYAKMRNVWFIPSVKMLEVFLKRAGFKNIRCVDINQTSIEEQRATDWMTFESLSDFLDPSDNNKTIESYPTPLRATIIATKV